MALVKRFTPGGNLYPDGSSTFATLVSFFHEQAKNLDTIQAALETRLTSTLSNLATTAGGEAVATARSYTDNQVAGARSSIAAGDAATLASANAYTDEQVTNVQAGVVTPVSIDAGVNRALNDGRIDVTVTAESIASFHEDVIDLKHLGATGLNTVSNAQFKAAIDAARAARRLPPPGAGNDHIGTKTINVPAGTYRITDLMGLMGTELQSIKLAGLRFKGAGTNLTTIIFDPAEDGPLAFNNYWMNIKFEGFTFRTMRAGATFMQSYTWNAAQRYTFVDISWSGPWKYVLDLKGNNNNCEFSFYACQTSGMANDGAFLYIGATDTSDQFLNYWFFGFKHWSTAAPVVDAARGGHFHFFGLDVSDWAPNAAEFSPIFKLRGKTHAGGVQNLTANAMRVEAKNPNAALLYSEWGDGNVSIQCDYSSQVNWVTYNDIIRIKLDNVKGPIYTFRESNLVGGVQIEYGSDTWHLAPAIRFRDTNWAQRLTPSEVVSYVRPATNAVDPSVEFIDCRGTGANPYQEPGAPVWDATIGWSSGPLVRPLRKRQVSVRAVGGNIAGTSSLKLNLPVGALITGMRAFGPAGAVTETDGGSWTVSTTEATPRAIATVTVPGSRAAGYNVATEPAAPFLCSTREAASIRVTATDIAQSNSNCLVTIEGYW